MPLSDFQKHILRLLATQRSDESYVAGGAPIAAWTSRYSGDFDIFHDSEAVVATAAEADAVVLARHGLTVAWLRQGRGNWAGEVLGGPEPLKLEWAHDSGFRFFEVQPDDDFGFVLHPADLTTNKALTIADRREARDVFDIVSLSKRIPIAAAILAAPAKDPGYSPESLIAAIKRSIAHPQIAFDRLRSDMPIDGGALLRDLRHDLELALTLAASMPDDAIGKFYLQDGAIIVPDPARLGAYGVREASYKGIVPRPASI